VARGIGRAAAAVEVMNRDVVIVFMTLLQGGGWISTLPDGMDDAGRIS
jgi:hypothetical protein